MKQLLVILTVLISLIITGSSSETDNEVQDDGKLHIYTTVYPLKYFTEEIGKQYVSVNTIYPPGSDEHTFEPSQKDMIKLADAHLFIYVGLGLEGFVNKAKQTLENEDVVLLAAGEHIDIDDDHHHAHEEEDGHQHSDIDPHVWIDPLYSKELAESIKEELIRQLPNHKEELEKNYATLASHLEQIDSQFEYTIEKAQHKQIVVSHAAYGYWERYGLEQISISGLSSSSEPTQKELKEIIEKGKEHDLKYIFFEQNVSSRLAETVQNEMKAEPLTLHNLAVLTDEDMKQNRTYFSIMEDNLKALEKALNE